MTDNLSSHNSSDYEDEITKTIPYYNWFHAETINLVKSISGRRKIWLDTGCGTGSLIEKALVEFPDYKFYLADPSDKMLETCKKRFNVPQVEIVGKYDTASLKDNIKPDIISAIQSHHYMRADERKKATQKCYDLLNDNGLYITFENIKFDSDTGNENALRRWGEFQEKNGRDKLCVQKHLNRFDNNYYPIRISEHIDLMRQTGFAVVELFWMSYMQAGFYGIKR